MARIHINDAGYPHQVPSPDEQHMYVRGPLLVWFHPPEGSIVCCNNQTSRSRRYSSQVIGRWRHSRVTICQPHHSRSAPLPFSLELIPIASCPTTEPPTRIALVELPGGPPVEPHKSCNTRSQHPGVGRICWLFVKAEANYTINSGQFGSVQQSRLPTTLSVAHSLSEL